MSLGDPPWVPLCSIFPRVLNTLGGLHDPPPLFRTLDITAANIHANPRQCLLKTRQVYTGIHEVFMVVAVVLEVGIHA